MLYFIFINSLLLIVHICSFRFIVYKLPRIKHSADPYLANGVGYIYMDSSSYRFKMPSKSINSTNSTVGYTLQQIYISYQRSGDIAFLMYNDEDASGIVLKKNTLPVILLGNSLVRVVAETLGVVRGFR